LNNDAWNYALGPPSGGSKNPIVFIELRLIGDIASDSIGSRALLQFVRYIPEALAVCLMFGQIRQTQ
jgi:hypothetical protein